MSNEEPYHEYSAGPYDTTAQRTPIPPPPPPPTGWYSNPYDPYRKQKRSPWYYVLIAFLLCVIGGSVLVIWLKFNTTQTPTTTTSMTSTARPATATPIKKPTSDGSHSLLTSDYQRFIDNFSYATMNNDYTAIEQVADTNNFQSISINTADGIASGWDLTQRELANKEITLYLRQAIITPDVAQFNCSGRMYGPTGVTVNAFPLIKVPNADVKYDVGSIFSNAPESNNPPDSVVFIFEQPNHTGQWFWRGYVFGNTTNCQ